MSVGSGKNVHNEKAVGLSEQLCECKRRRGGGAESATGEDPRRKAGIADARKEGRGLAPPQASTRGGIYRFVLNGNGKYRERPPLRLPIEGVSQNAKQDPRETDHSMDQ